MNRTIPTAATSIVQSICYPMPVAIWSRYPGRPPRASRLVSWPPTVTSTGAIPSTTRRTTGGITPSLGRAHTLIPNPPKALLRWIRD